MTSKYTPDQLQTASHDAAYRLMLKILESQPNLTDGAEPNFHGGAALGAMLESLYDQLVVLTRKHLEGKNSAD